MAATDQEGLDRYRAGDANALADLVEKYRRPLFAFILNMTAGRDEADEIFQEVWLRAIRSFHLYREKNFFGWIVRIAHNLIIDRGRRKKPDVSLDAEPENGRSAAETLAGDDPGPLSRMAARDVGRRIADAVGGLPPEQREVFLMRVEAGLPFKEIARIQRTSINTALARMHYALSKLRPLLADEYAALGR